MLVAETKCDNKADSNNLSMEGRYTLNCFDVKNYLKKKKGRGERILVFAFLLVQII